MEIVSLDKLSKNYGTIRALKEVSFSVPSGTVFGILGPNGSGKSTLLGIIMDVLKATSGTYQLFEQVPLPASRKQIGTLLETPNFYHYLSAVQNLQIVASIKGRSTNDIERVLKIVNLWNRKDSKFNTYSLGMKQRLAIASALLGDPDVLVLDEPTNGLDPVGIAEIRDLIRKLSQQGKTIIMASHLLDEVEKVCTHVAILKQGTLITSGNVDDILVNDDIVEIGTAQLSSGFDSLKPILEKISGVHRVELLNNLIRLHFPPGKADLAQVNRQCFEQGVLLNHLILRKKSLESKFFELTN